MKTKTNISFLISLFLLLVAATLIVYALYQIESKTNLIKTHYAEDSQEISRASSSKLKKEQESLLQKENVFRNVFLTQDEIIPFISNIESIAAESGLKVEITKVERGTEEVVGSSYKIQPISFNISLEGSLDNSTLFVEKMINQEKLFELKEFKIYKVSDINNSYNTRIVLMGNIFNI